jgi:succinate dehydrogenase/fumarate reductase flavoprotein subunit
LLLSRGDESVQRRIEVSDQKRLNRRDFLKGAATAGAGLAAAGAFGASSATPVAAQAAPNIPAKWDYEADVVVLGAGAAGLPAALRARDAGSSVIIVEANWDVGGHAAVSGGNLHSGAGTEIQKKYGIEDSPNQYYMDHTTNLTLGSRYNDRDVLRVRANDMAPAFEYILANGVLIYDQKPTGGANSYLTGGTGIESVPRDTLANPEPKAWVSYSSGKADGSKKGIGLTRPLEASARAKGVQFLMNYHMDSIVRENPDSGRVIGIRAHYSPTFLPGSTTPLKGLFSDGNINTTAQTLTVKAKKAVIIATGGHTSNVNFRRIFDPRLTEEYDGVSGDPFSRQDASGEIAAMGIGASLGCTANQTLEMGSAVTKPRYVGCQYGYQNLQWLPGSPIFPLVGASGLAVADYQNAILVNMLGKRFWDETKSDYDFLAACMGSVVLNPDSPTDSRRVGGPIWAIFDADAVTRNKWNVTPPDVDIAGGRFFSGNTIAELAGNIVNKYFETTKMSASVLQDTVTRYNSFVDKGVDEDFNKPKPLYKIQTPPFYAAWATPTPHDTLAGLRINGKCQVIDINSRIIPGLYAAGEAAGGHQVHGHGKVITAGYTAGTNAAKEPSI